MEKIKTIDEFSTEYWNETANSTIETVSKKTAKQMAIEFAKYHVELALTKASKEAETDMWDPDYPTIDEGSILNAYPLSNIK